MDWTVDRVESWLLIAASTLPRCPDLEERYLRNTLRAHMPEVVESSASAFARALAVLQQEGVLERTHVRQTRPEALEIDIMEQVLMGLPKPRMGLQNTTPWLAMLPFKRRRLLWRRALGTTWESIAGLEQAAKFGRAARRSGAPSPSIRTCQRWYREGLRAIADELASCG